jgi:putative SOS response-associated peptidase YedK
MCGRYCITSAPEAIRRLFRYPEQPNFPPRYNVAPTQPVPIVRWLNSERHFALVRWGLLPAWVKDPKAFALVVNARGESVNDKPAFRNAMKRRRCLFPADGFYEWKEEGGRKRAFFAHPAAPGPIAFAGLWETWTGPNGEEMETAAIVTTEANPTLATVHHRAPVIVPPPEGSMQVYEVSTAVNRVANDSPMLLQPLDPSSEAPSAEQPKSARRARQPVDTGQGSLF